MRLLRGRSRWKVPRRPPVVVEFSCPDCGYRWSAPAVRDMGRVDLVDEARGDHCQECGQKGLED